ncbi:hypothetical protein MPTK1_3g10370 [Marchantia polymorpha subsp. ruderalis]|uniref:Protein unc-45 homolog B n=2 Tax=Marchantia polymorpha TaxID=3197 RepID=A0A176VWT0_MARPO|nr:hypothetical protein AXG93_3776s1060 [Marchantia polymorpha subsp. ruderalis]PTQ27361.1 hypothetical protein MARPO_0203s0010 [Marchantia polymorpha]BBN05108.1 hypothetical protein Mp_3g10370 [Marchantia polymorpha subsp. ruderalis]|eukprot:PTQ27361.1 hypothetical protein MARPO_0203s0010 [Marchantia polymorpha]
MAAAEDEGLTLALDRTVDAPSLVMVDQRGSETMYIMGLAFADEDESPSPRRSFGKESPNLQELPARAWGKEVHTGRLSHVVIAVDARANNKWRRTKSQKGVKGLVRRLGSSSSKAWKKCFRPCMDIDSERAIDLGNLNSDDMLKESVPVLFKDDSPGLQEQAMRALLHLSGIYGNPLKIVSFPKAVEGVVRLLLRDDEPNLQRLATLTLGNLALRQVNAVASVAMEGLARLLFEKEGRSLELSIQLQEEAASVLANICYAPEGGRKVMNPWTDALAGLIKLLFMNDRKGAQEEATRALVNLALVQENAQKLLEFPTVSVIGGLVGLLTDFERPAVLDNATRALASLSYAPQNARKIAESEHFGRALQGLVGMLMRRRRKDATLQELAVMTLANLSITPDIQIQIADFPNVLPELLWCLTQSNDHSVVEHAAMAMGNLAIAQENRPKIANLSGVLRALVDVMADDENPGGQEHAAYALSNLSHAHEWNQLKIADVPGVMKGVVHLLTMEASPSSQEQAARLLANLTYPQENSAKIITYPSALTGLAALLAKHENINLQREVTRAFANLTCSRDNRWISAFCTEGLARVLVTYSARRHAASSVEIVEIPEAAIPQLETKPSMLAASGEGEGETGLALGDAEEMMEVRMVDIAAVEGVKAAEQGLAALALESQEAPTSQRCDGQVLVVEDDLPKSPRPEVAPEAMTVEQPRVTVQPSAIAKSENEHESDEHHMEVKMLDVASVEHVQAANISEKRVLSYLEKSERISRIENISKKLSRLAMHPDQASMETLPDLTTTVSDETDTSKFSATGKDQQQQQQAEIDLEMEHLAEVDEGGSTLEQSRPLLAEFQYRRDENELRTREVENLILEQASIALGNLAIHKENKRIIGECEDALSGLLGLLPRYDSPSVQENAAWALANLFHEEDGSDVVDTIAELKGPRAIQSLGELLLDNEIPLVQEQATRALANLAYFPENQAEIIELPKALSGVVGLMSNDENPGIQEKAVRLLTNLTCAKEYWTTIAEFPGVVPGLSDLLAKEQNPDIQRTAAMCLSNLALAPENIPTLVESPSAMASVVELLSNDENPGAQEQAAKFIVNVAACHDATHQLRISEFPRILPELEKFLFQDESPGVQEQAIKAIVNLARTPENKQKVMEEPDALLGIARMLSRDDNSVVQLNGALAFKNLSLEISSLQKLVDCPNVLAGLVRLLSRHGDYALEAAVLTLLNLSRLRHIAIAIAKYDYPKVLIDLAMLLRMSNNKLVVESTAMILTNLANAPENRQLMADVPEVAKGLEWLLSDCALEEQLLMTAMSDSQTMVISDAEGELDEAGVSARGFDNKESLKGQRTGTGFWAATALTLIDLPRARGLTLHSGEAYKGRGNAMIWMGLVKEAIEEFDVSTQLQPEAPGTFSLRGIAKSLIQDYEAALIDADRGIELDPQYGGWYQERGILKRMMGDLPGALADLNKAVELEKDDYEMLKHRGYVRFLLHDEDGAREDAEWALRVQDLSATLDESQYHDYIMSFLGALPVEYLDYKLR